MPTSSPTPRVPSPLTPEREQEIRETHPGSWYAGAWTQDDVESNGDEPAYCRVVHHESGTTLATLPDFAGPIALFVADAHDAVPELLAELDRLRSDRAAFRAEVLREAAAEVVASCPDHGQRDEAWMDCHCIVGEWLLLPPTAAPVPVETADVEPEFAVRWPDGNLTPASDRAHGLRAIESARRAEPAAVLIQRTCTPWTEVTS